MLVRDAEVVTGGLSTPSKMPGYSYNLPAQECSVGSKLRLNLESVCAFCYALKGRYVFPQTIAAMYRRLGLLRGHEWCKGMAFLISRYARTKNMLYFRWHDAGDLQDLEHMHRIADVCEATPEVSHWLPTKEFGVISRFVKERDIPDNLCVRLSAFMVDQAPSRTIPGTQFSTVHSKEATEGAFSCPSRFQHGECGDCRACWDKSVEHTSYYKH